MCQNKCADCACAGADTRDEQLTETDLEQIWQAAYPERPRPTVAGLFVRDLCQALQATRETRFPIALPDLTELGNRSAT